MLKYQLKKDVTLEDGMSFKYSSKEELSALIIAINKNHSVYIEKVNYGILKGFLIVDDTRKEYISLITSKFLTRSDQYIVSKKDVFTKQYNDEDTKKEDVPLKDMSLNSIQMANASDININ
ncbi:MAG: hypothetical protein WAT79_08255 [Saprospiraceae bacterium]